MGQRWRSKAKFDWGDESVAVIIVSSSDDDAANGDLSLGIVGRAGQRETKLRSSGEGPGVSVPFSVIDLSSTSSDEVEVLPELAADAGGGAGLVASPEVEKKKKKKKRRKPKKKRKNVEENGAVDPPVKEEDGLGAADSVWVNEASDNVVLRGLLRGPRYFDPGERILEICYNCREEGHSAANCTMRKRQKPCFVCGMFGHYAKQCTQGRDCYICRRRGHLAKNCPNKHKQTAQDSMICLRCGDIGHDMLSCTNDYAPDDLKEIQCYICSDYGHLCCVGFTFSSPRVVSCYDCGQFGHTGSACAKRHGETSAVSSSTSCYRCGEGGHFARGCTKNAKSARWIGEPSSTPTTRKILSPFIGPRSTSMN